MTFQLLINGTDYTEALITQSLNIAESRQINSSRMQLQLHTTFVPAVMPFPKAGQGILFLANGEREFGGRISRIAMSQTGINTLALRLDCTDFTVDFDNILINKSIEENDRAGDIVREIIGIVGRGFTAGTIDAGPPYSEIEANYDRPSSIISRIAQDTQRDWYVDYHRRVHYFVPELAFPAPIPEILVDDDIVNYQDLEFAENWAVKNRLYIDGIELRAERDRIEVDGPIGFIPLHWPPWSRKGTRIWRNGVPQEILVDGLDGSQGDGIGVNGQAFFCQTNWGIRFPDNARITEDESVVVEYDTVQPSLEVVQDQESIDTMRELENWPLVAPSDGIHELKISIPNKRLSDRAALTLYAEGLLNRYKEIDRTARFQSNTQGWRAGQHFALRSPERGIDEDFMYVKSVTKTIRHAYDGVPTLKYDVEASSNPYHL